MLSLEFLDNCGMVGSDFLKLSSELCLTLLGRLQGDAILRTGALQVRRPDQHYSEAAARVLPPGTAALHAVKRLWAHDWTLPEVVQRLDTAGSVGLEARPTLLLPTSQSSAPAAPPA